jgi:hypothetical protein
MGNCYASNYFTFVAFPLLQLEKFLAGWPDEYAFEDAELPNVTQVIALGDQLARI